MLAGLRGSNIVDFARPSALASVGSGSGQPGAGPLDYGVAFELNEEDWPGPVVLTSIFSVELPGIEPAYLPGIIRSELQVHRVSLRFVPAGYRGFRLGS